MSGVHEGTCHSARSSVHILVGAPAGEIDVPVVESEFDISGGVGTVPADGDAVRMRMLGDSLDVEELTGVVLDGGEEDES